MKNQISDIKISLIVNRVNTAEEEISKLIFIYEEILGEIIQTEI